MIKHRLGENYTIHFYQQSFKCSNKKSFDSRSNRLITYVFCLITVYFKNALKSQNFRIFVAMYEPQPRKWDIRVQVKNRRQLFRDVELYDEFRKENSNRFRNVDLIKVLVEELSGKSPILYEKMKKKYVQGNIFGQFQGESKVARFTKVF